MRALLPLIIIGSLGLAAYIAVNYYAMPKNKRPEFSPGLKMIGYTAAGMACVTIIFTVVHVLTTVESQL